MVGFGGEDLPGDTCLAEYQNQLQHLIREHDCESPAVDCRGVMLMPSGSLGLLTSIHRDGVHVLVFNASPDVREVLEITGLDEKFWLGEVDLPA